MFVLFLCKMVEEVVVGLKVIYNLASSWEQFKQFTKAAGMKLDPAGKVSSISL